MNRDPRLRGLSSEHHNALGLSRALAAHDGEWTVDDGAQLRSRFEAEIEPHFRIEEEVLLPALRLAGAQTLADRTQLDHDFLRTKLIEAHAGDGEAARAFGERMREHVRFEERELFPACEELLPSAALDEIARRIPHGPDRS